MQTAPLGSAVAPVLASTTSRLEASSPVPAPETVIVETGAGEENLVVWNGWRLGSKPWLHIEYRALGP